MSMLKLHAGHWYGWQMLPGYEGGRAVPYFSPVYVGGVIPRKTGVRQIGLQFLNPLYAQGVQDFGLELQILLHAPQYLVARIVDADRTSSPRTAVVSHVEFEWIRRFCPELWESQPPSSFTGVEQRSVSAYLDAVFGRR